jgi:hypothetical protein
MALIISGTTSTGVSLVSGDNPVSITSSGYVSNTSGNYAISGPSGTAWTITNAGTIAGKTDGISLAATGALVANQITGTITGGNNAIRISATGETISNAGMDRGRGAAQRGHRQQPGDRHDPHGLQ